jgi:hypothetical protein
MDRPEPKVTPPAESEPAVVSPGVEPATTGTPAPEAPQR